MSRIKYIPGEKLAYIATTTAIAISNEFDLEDLNILSNIFNAIGDNIGIIAAQKEAIKTLSESSAPADKAVNSADKDKKTKDDSNPSAKDENKKEST